MSVNKQDKYVEIEVKLYTPDLNAVKTRLVHLGATLKIARVFERNIRYENMAKTLTRDGIVIRLRQDNHVRLTYKAKGVARNDGLVEREELEVTISDFNTMEQILARLGYDPYMVYEKYRTTYDHANCEIVLDEMPYGNFVEIEGEPQDIEVTVSQLELQDATRYSASYSRLFDYVRQHLNLTCHDLTFANFEDIDVPENAFQAPEDFT